MKEKLWHKKLFYDWQGAQKSQEIPFKAPPTQFLYLGPTLHISTAKITHQLGMLSHACNSWDKRFKSSRQTCALYYDHSSKFLCGFLFCLGKLFWLFFCWFIQSLEKYPREGMFLWITFHQLHLWVSCRYMCIEYYYCHLRTKIMSTLSALSYLLLAYSLNFYIYLTQVLKWHSCRMIYF